MKTTTNINRIDIIALIAVIILFAFMMPLKAESTKTAASQRAIFNNELEKSVEYTAPVVSGNFEIMAAESRLEELFTSVAQEAAYSSPEVHENIETATAVENLDSLNSEIEKSVRYTPSPVTE